MVTLRFIVATSMSGAAGPACFSISVLIRAGMVAQSVPVDETGDSVRFCGIGDKTG